MLPHFFLSATGDMLPRWRQAFPRALSALTHDESTQTKAELIWLRLVPNFPVAQQINEIRQRHGETGLIVLSDIPNDEEALAAFIAGARGYCNSHATAELLKQIAGVVAKGGIWIGESLMQRLLNVSDHLPAPAKAKENDWADQLTEREQQVAETIITGASNKEIARQLGITERTVKAHVGAILDKLQVRDRLQLALLIRGRLRA